MKLDLTNIDSIIFDFGGVVLNLNYQLTIDKFKELGQDNFENLYAQANQDKVFDAYEIGEISSEDFIQYLVNLMPSKIDHKLVIQAWNAMLLDLPVERIDLLKSLSKRFKLFLFSNTNEIHFNSFSEDMEAKYGDIKMLDSIFEKCYYSHKVGYRKPNKEAFQLVLDEQDLIPEKVLFIDDSIQHVEGAKKMGIRTHHLVKTDILSIFNK